MWLGKGNAPSSGGAGSTEIFTETTANGSTAGDVADAASEEITIGCSDTDFIIDAVFVACTTAGTDIDVDFDLEIYQKDAMTVDAADTAHDIQSAYNLIYIEEGITLHNTKINNGSNEAIGQDTITVDNSTNLRKYDLLYFDEDADNWYRLAAVNSATEIEIFDNLVAEKTDNVDILQVYEKKALGMFFNKSTENNIYINITNNSGGNRAFTVYVKITRLAT